MLQLIFRPCTRLAPPRCTRLAPPRCSIILIPILLLFLSSCSKPDPVPTYILPSDISDKTDRCLTFCTKEREGCERRSYRKFQTCRDFSERRYRRCFRNAALTRRARRARSSSRVSVLCQRSPCFYSVKSCDRGYDLCFVECGGSIEVRDEPEEKEEESQNSI